VTGEATPDPAAIHTHALTKSYHGRPAVRGIDLVVPRGVVFGYLGPNGAGKTTTIRMLAGLVRPTSGHAAVFGHDVVDDREAAQRRLGYLPGDFVAYPRLTGAQYLRYLSDLRGGTPWAAAPALADRLDLDLRVRINQLSHGNRQKLGIIQAFLHQPDLLILDEPSAGLDPLVQREFLAMVREVRDRGGTVFLSSHVLSEVEAVADVVGMLREGELIVVQPVEELKAQAQRRIELTFGGAAPVADIKALDSVTLRSSDLSSVDVLVRGSTSELIRAVAPYDVTHIVTHEPDLEEIFLAYYRKDSGRAAHDVH
jgi:ABC-2 type transport system ATP-binding protein